ncbi:hypothetical protein LZ30DRAFT_828020 [Colletotrichum cereale]|nr:hypothetical protein LZ30DRAFT_828020 [Colletotrichum cereale]
MATSRRSHCGTQRPLTPRRANCFKTKRRPRDPAFSRRRVPGLPVRRHHRGSAWSSLGGNQLIRSQGYHSTSPSALRLKSLPEKHPRAGSFASFKKSLEGNLVTLDGLQCMKCVYRSLYHPISISSSHGKRRPLFYATPGALMARTASKKHIKSGEIRRLSAATRRTLCVQDHQMEAIMGPDMISFSMR